MSLGLVGRKVGMTRVFSEDGVSTPVTVVEIEANRISQLKTVENDGYTAVQVVTGTRRPSRVTKPMAGHYRKAGVEPGSMSMEFRVDSLEGLELGADIKLDMFEQGQKVDVSGTTIGKGFQGVIKRYNFAMQDATHGNSVSHRAPGSIGQNQTPGRVFKGKKMSGHMGAVTQTTQNLEIFRIDVERNLVLIKGPVPGPKSGNVVIRQAEKG